jgi:hypothetical protein
MDPAGVPGDAVLLLDTTVDIDGLKRTGLPADIQALPVNRVIRHSAICGRRSVRSGLRDRQRRKRRHCHSQRKTGPAHPRVGAAI